MQAESKLTVAIRLRNLELEIIFPYPSEIACVHCNKPHGLVTAVTQNTHCVAFIEVQIRAALDRGLMVKRQFAAVDIDLAAVSAQP